MVLTFPMRWLAQGTFFSGHRLNLFGPLGFCRLSHLKFQQQSAELSDVALGQIQTAAGSGEVLQHR